MTKYDDHERLRLAERPEDWPEVRPDGRRECPICRAVDKVGDGVLPLRAHFDAAYRRWCPGGPTPDYKDKARRMRSRNLGGIVPGGAPGLGKR